MKHLLSALLIGSLLFSCKKNNDNTPQKDDPIKVAITDSVKIGTLYWTTSNYDGPGGAIYANAATANPGWGKLYLYSEVKSLVLPKGWRLPTVADFENLLKAEGATLTDQDDGYSYGGQDLAAKLMSTSGWAANIGTNSSGFNAFATGVVGSGGSGVFYGGYGTTSDKYSSTFVIAAFMSSSTFNDPKNVNLSGGTASLAIYQDYQDSPFSTKALITSFNPNVSSPGSGRLSVRFVRDN